MNAAFHAMPVGLAFPLPLSLSLSLSLSLPLSRSLPVFLTGLQVWLLAFVLSAFTQSIWPCVSLPLSHTPISLLPFFLVLSSVWRQRTFWGVF